MPSTNPLVAGGMVGTSAGAGAVTPSRDIALGVGPVHLTVIGIVVASIAALVLMHKAGFHFSVTVGGR